MTIPDQIERAALIGWKLFPCSTESRAMAFKGAHLKATDDLEQIEKWCWRFPKCNWRVIFGPSNLWGFDLDIPGAEHKNDGIAALASLAKVHGPIPPRPQARSGSGGLGIFFQYHGERIIGDTNKPLPGMDPRRGQQSQTIPPSIHTTTHKPYFWVDPPWVLAPPVAPSWLLHLVEAPAPHPVRPAPHLKDGDARRNYAVAALHNGTRSVASAYEGTRNDSLNRACWSVARFLADGSLSENEVRDCFVAAARACGIPIREACLTIDSAIRSRRK